MSLTSRTRLCVVHSESGLDLASTPRLRLSLSTNTAFATRNFREALFKLFGLNFSDEATDNQDINDSQATGNDDENLEDGHGSDALEDEEWEDTQSDTDDDDANSTDFEGDGGECGADEEDELGFASF